MRTIHLMLNVSDINIATTFYSKLLGKEPTKRKEDYAQWKIANPDLNLSLKQNPNEPYGVNHLGIETKNEDDLNTLRSNAYNAKASLEEEGITTCCYAKSDKSWAKDPDGIEWELFYSYANSMAYYEGASLIK